MDQGLRTLAMHEDLSSQHQHLHKKQCTYACGTACPILWDREIRMNRISHMEVKCPHSHISVDTHIHTDIHKHVHV